MQIRLDELHPSSDNPRVTPASTAEDEQLRASIKAHGQIYPLIVRKVNGHWEVADGNRRLREMKALGLESAECHPTESNMSIFEVGAVVNMIRAKMHALDESDVICRLIDAGETPGEVAVRFGQSELWAKQRVALSTLNDGIKAMMRKGELGGESAVLLTRLDAKKQAWWLKEVKKNEHLKQPHMIRSIARDEAIDARRALFPISLYPEDKIKRDLFSDEVLLLDAAKFEELQASTLDAMREGVLAEGWNDVVVLRTYEARDKFRKGKVHVTGRISKKRMADMTAVIYVSEGGLSTQVDIERGWVASKLAKKVNVAAGAKGTEAEVEDVREAGPLDLTGSQKAILQYQLTANLQAMLVTDTLYATYWLVTAVLQCNPAGGTGIDRPVNYTTIDAQSAGEDHTPVTYGQDLDYEDWVKMPKAQKEMMIRHAAARMVSIVALSDAANLPDEVIEAVVPSKGFLQRYTLGVLNNLCDHLERRVDKKLNDQRPQKKGELVDYLHGRFTTLKAKKGGEVLLVRQIVDAAAVAEPADTSPGAAEDC